MDDEEQYNVPGSCPEFGAIFMSNYATKRECLKRKVFALPYSMSHFVKQVKSGMILFLFEFEKRELHGVFQACSDGAMNILPHAFVSLGRQFPAQVKFTCLWDCHPLSEDEFRDAIRENYFSKNKFKFGLSEDQVQRLLSLFSLKRLKDQAPHRQLTRSKGARPSGYSTSKTRRLVDNDRSPRSNKLPSEFHLDSNHGPVISTRHFEDSLSNDDRATGDGRFETHSDVGYAHQANGLLNECFQDLRGKVGGNINSDGRSDGLEIEWNPAIELQPAALVGYSSGNFRSLFDDVRFAKSDTLETKGYEDDGFAPNITKAYPSPFQSKVNPQAYSSKHVLNAESFIDESARMATFCTSTEMQNSGVNYPITFEDSIVTTLPHDPDVSDIRYRGFSSLGLNQSHTSLQQYGSHDDFAGDLLGLSTNQPFPSSLETRRTTLTPDISPASRDSIPFSYSNQYEYSSRTSQPRHDNYDDLAADYSKREGWGDPSLLKPPFSPVHSEIRNNVRISEQPSSYRTSPSKFPSFPFSEKYHSLLRDKHDSPVPEHKNDAEFYDDGFMFKEFHHLRDSFYNVNRPIEDDRYAMYKNIEREHKEKLDQMHVHEPTNVVHHEVTSLSPAAFQNSEGIFPDHQKKRSSVFSRLALPSKACQQESKTCAATAFNKTNASVNEVMDMLHRSHYSWMKTRCKDHDNAVKIKDKKMASRKDSAMISEEMNAKPIPLRKEISSQKTEETTFVDFKRRSAVRKNLEDGKTGSQSETLNNKSESALQCKKRKLIRPVLCENEAYSRGISAAAPEIVSGCSTTECSDRENAESTKVSLCHVNENDLSENVKLPDVLCQSAVESNNLDKGSGSNPQQLVLESFTALRSADEGGKELLQNHVFSSMTAVTCKEKLSEVEQDLSTTDIKMDGSSPDHNDVSHITQESPSQIREHSDNNIAKGQVFNNIERINNLCSAPLVARHPSAI